jgi:hypothetical protein
VLAIIDGARRMIFYPRLTMLRPGGNQVIRNVFVMTAHFSPASGPGDRDTSRSRAGGQSALASGFSRGTGVRPGESDPARMLSGVLVLVVVTIILVVALVWWLV